MKNDVEHGRELRQVSYKGRYRLMWAQVDADGDIVRLLKNEDVDASFRSLDELRALIALVEGAKGKSIITVNSGNERMYFVGEG